MLQHGARERVDLAERYRLPHVVVERAGYGLDATEQADVPKLRHNRLLSSELVADPSDEHGQDDQSDRHHETVCIVHCAHLPMCLIRLSLSFRALSWGQS